MEDLQNDYNELLNQIAYLKDLLASREKRLGVIKDELIYVRDRYADKRRTVITYDEGDLNDADLIPRHSCVITVSDTGYIKRVPTATYRSQHRGGKGVIGMETKEEDHVAHLFNADSHDIIFFITDRGFMCWLNVYDIPEGARTGKGKAIINLIKIEAGERIQAMLTVNKDMFENPDLSIVMATRMGVIKKTKLSEFKNLRKVGIRALIIEEGDDLIGAELCDQSSEILLSTVKGMACRFHANLVRSMGRAARGVTGIKFKLDGDSVVSMEVVPAENQEIIPEATEAEMDVEVPEIDEPEIAEETAEIADDAEEQILEDCDDPQLLVVTSGGMGKRSYVKDYRLTKRGAKGVKNLNLAEDEEVVKAVRVQKGDEILITTQFGLLTRIQVDEIRIVGRNSKGVRIMNLKEGDRIIGVSCVVEVQGEEEKTEASDIPQGVFASAGAGNDPQTQAGQDDEEYYSVDEQDLSADAGELADNDGDSTEL